MPNQPQQQPHLVLVTGATGYVGGRLVPRLLQNGYRVRVMSRDVRHLQGRSWLEDVEIVQGDMLKPETLTNALKDVDAAYYLIHSMSDSNEFKERDRQAAHHFGRAARQAGTQHIVYLGGLGDETEALSTHLESRHEVGHILRQYSDRVTEFRAAIVVGSGSMSFEMIRYLTQRLPGMLGPTWLYSRTQPIAIDDLLDYLVSALTTPAAHGRIVQIGGADVITYRDMLIGYAQARNLKRLIIPVPMFMPHLSSYWVHLFTPLPFNLIKPLVKSLEHDMVIQDESAQTIFPHIQPMAYRQALKATLEELSVHHVETSWADSMAATWETDEPYTFTSERGMFIEQRNRTAAAPPDVVFSVVNQLGGQTGWLYLDRLWQLRGLLDRIIGGGGYLGRRDSQLLRVGDVVDFWRVEAVEPNKLLRLRAEMKLPGRGWLQFEIKPDNQDDSQSHITQTAYYAPHGLLGHLYWYALFVIHKFIFDGMIDQIVALAEQEEHGQARLQSAARTWRPILLAGLVTLTLAGSLLLLIARRNHTTVSTTN